MHYTSGMFKDAKDYNIDLRTLNGSHYRRGYKLSAEHKRKISDAHQGKKLSDATKQKLSILNKGKKLSDEHKRKIGLASQNRVLKPSKPYMDGLLGKPASKWAKELGVSVQTIYSRVKKYGTPYEIKVRIRKSKKYEGKTVKEWAQALKVSTTTIGNRLKKFGTPYDKNVDNPLIIKRLTK